MPFKFNLHRYAEGLRAWAVGRTVGRTSKPSGLSGGGGCGGSGGDGEGECESSGGVVKTPGATRSSRKNLKKATRRRGGVSVHNTY